MTLGWHDLMKLLLDAVEDHLCRTAPQAARRELACLRSRAMRARSRKEQKALSRSIEKCLDSRPCFRGAFRRYIRAEFTEKIIPALEELVRLATELRRRMDEEKARGARTDNLNVSRPHDRTAGKPARYTVKRTNPLPHGPEP